MVMLAVLLPILLGAEFATRQASSCPVTAGTAVDVPVPGGANRTAAAQMSVFKRAKRSSDALPSELDLVSDPRCSNCRLLPKRSRLLLSGAGSRDLRLYAVPTADGRVCTQMTRTLEAGCTVRSSFTLTVWDEGGPGECLPVHVSGIAPDRVRAVDIVVRGRRQRAQLGSNSFFFELRNPRAAKTAVKAAVFRLKTGREFRIRLGF
jgi:hypothetical protein